MNYKSLLVIIFMSLAIGCSGASPIAPNADTLLTASRETVTSTTGNLLWGIWNVSIDPDTLTAEITPLRGPAFTANVTQFMQHPASPTNMVSFSVGAGSDPPTGYFEVDVTLKHPFPGLNMYNGFDVRGILLADGSIAGSHDSTVLRAGPDDTRLLNADGYTRWWNYPEFTDYGTVFGFNSGKLAPPNMPTATVNPYKYFAEGLNETAPVTDLDPSTRGFFPTIPGTQTRTYEIQFKMDGDAIVFDFQYATCASWDEPDPAFAPDYPQEAFDLSANCQEAFNLSVSDAGSSAYFIDPSDSGGELVLDIEVYDWQAAQNPAGVEGEVAGLWLEGDILLTPVDVLASAVILPGSTSVSSVYEITIGSLNLTQSGIETLFCTVENLSPNSYMPQIPGGETFAYPVSPLAAYFTFDVTIGTDPLGVSPTVLSIDPDSGYQNITYEDVAITGTDFDPACSVEIEYAPGDTLTILNFQYQDSENLTFDLDLTDATLGLYDVIVTNPSAAPGVLEDGFEVLEPGIWLTTQGDIANSGHIGLNGPSGNLNDPDWSNDLCVWNVLNVFLNEDTAFFSTVGVSTANGYTAAVNLSDGSTKWTQAFSSSGNTYLACKGLSDDGSIVFCQQSNNGTMYGLDAVDGSEVWQTPGSIRADAFVTLDLDGNFIVPALDGVRSMDPQTGAVNWTTPIGNSYYCTPAVGPDGTIYAYSGFSGIQIRAIDPADGSIKWTSSSLGECHNGITVHPDSGNIIVFNRIGGTGYLRCLQDNGSSYSTVWTQNYPYSWYSSTAVGPDGSIYLMDYSGTLRRLNPDTGSTINSSSGWGNGYGARPAIGNDGLVYVGANYYFRVFNPDCTEKWSWYGGSSYVKGPAIGQDGWVYALNTNGIHAWHD